VTVSDQLDNKVNSKVILELRGLSKRFGGVNALNNVEFDLREGEVHGLVGENGAGKSTLMKILCGVYSDYEGQMLLNGIPVRFHSPADARSKGIGMVHQELSIFPHLSVAENIFSGNQPLTKTGTVDWKTMRQQAAQHLRELGISVNVTSLMGDLSVGTQQMVEIARIIFSGANIIIMDEPTSALSLPETKRLFSFIEQIKAQNKTVIFISHFLEDVLQISDRVTIFRNGRRVTTRETTNLTKHEIIEHMLGADSRRLLQAYEEGGAAERRSATKAGEVVFAVKDLSYKTAFQNISFSIRAGEILGLYSFVGAGQLELARCLFGVERPSGGSLQLKGQTVKLRNSRHAKKLGMAYVPENRRDSLALDKEIYKNVTLAQLDRLMPLFLQRRNEIQLTREKIQATRVRPPRPELEVGALSGGNQQKVVLAKWLVEAPQVLILAEPTRGMDVGAKEEVLELIHELRGRGVAILLISTELETILANCGRVVVMRKGHLTAEFEGEQMSKDNLLLYA
jgi:ribose transport system ATP-binding protein